MPRGLVSLVWRLSRQLWLVDSTILTSCDCLWMIGPTLLADLLWRFPACWRLLRFKRACPSVFDTRDIVIWQTATRVTSLTRARFNAMLCNGDKCDIAFLLAVSATFRGRSHRCKQGRVTGGCSRKGGEVPGSNVADISWTVGAINSEMPLISQARVKPLRSPTPPFENLHF